MMPGFTIASFSNMLEEIPSVFRYKRFSKDWASKEAGRLRALLVLVVRMTKKTVIARTPPAMKYTDIHYICHVYLIGAPDKDRGAPGSKGCGCRFRRLQAHGPNLKYTG